MSNKRTAEDLPLSTTPLKKRKLNNGDDLGCIECPDTKTVDKRLPVTVLSGYD